MKLSTLGENGLLELLTQNWRRDKTVLTGVGDDCAILSSSGKKSLLFKSDAVVEGIHFTQKMAGELVGRKALARALSDLAAMGGSPWAALITIGVPSSFSVSYLQKIYRGIEKCAARFKVNLVGGETTRSRDLFIVVSLLGEVTGRGVLRSTAKKNDEIWVTGSLGNTLQKKHLEFEPRLKEGQWLAQKGFASAMMDLSDGLGADLPRMAKASRLDYQIEKEKIPRSRGASLDAAWNDGEDYELLFAVPERKRKKLEKEWPFKVPITCIGKFISPKRQYKNFSGKGGYDHFKKR